MVLCLPLDFKDEIVSFLKYIYMNRFVLEIFIKLVFFCYNWIFMYKTVVGGCGFKVNI